VVKCCSACLRHTGNQFSAYIWPFRLAINYSVLNAEMFQWLLFRPLYMFGSNGTFILYAGPEPGADRAHRDTRGHGTTRQRCESRVWQ
jgi:hypothetical protein